MSLNPDACIPVRLEYYIAKLFTTQDIHGIEKDYSDLKETYQTAILDKGLLFRDEALVHTFQYHDPAHQVSLEGKPRIITVELSKAEQVIEKPAGVLFQRLSKIPALHRKLLKNYCKPTVTG
jgi:hypothetical protein